MKYNFTLPLSAILALSVLQLLMAFNILPPGGEMLDTLNGLMENYFFALIFFIILLESIIYVGFYFPGQFFAVVLVVGANPSISDVFYMTIAMVLAATFGSLINFELGKKSCAKSLIDTTPLNIKQLLLAMIHINSLAFFMFNQGAQHKSKRIIIFAGLLNLPYYLLLIAGTAVLSEKVMAFAENTSFLFSAIGIWLLVALYLDIKNIRSSLHKT
jgi:membrane-associated protein